MATAASQFPSATDQSARRGAAPDIAAELEATRALVEQLQHALDSRILIEQAKGIIAERYGVTLAEAFEAIRNVARPERRTVRDVAAAIVDRRDEMARTRQG